MQHVGKANTNYFNRLSQQMFSSHEHDRLCARKCLRKILLRYLVKFNWNLRQNLFIEILLRVLGNGWDDDKRRVSTTTGSPISP